MESDTITAASLAKLKPLLDGPAHSRLIRGGLLGSGGMAEVHAVFDEALLRRIARKTLHPDLLDNDAVVNEFVREVQITAALDHPYIVPVYDLGFDDEGHLFFTMKRIEGTNLKDFISDLEPGRLHRKTLLTLLEVLVKVCDALAFAHDRGVIHCDMKPEHIVMADYGQVYVMDWGVAHVTEDANPILAGLRADIEAEEEGVVRGTVQYMSPEQASADWDSVGAPSDVFSLGAILYGILTRFPPYMAPDIAEMLQLAQLGAFPPLAEEVEPGTLPPELENIISTAMSIDPNERYASAGELGDALRAFMGGGGEFPTVEFEGGQEIFKHGDKGDFAYIIKSGECEAYRMVEGERVSLEIMGAGTVFGEVALLTDYIRSASVVALEGGVEAYRIKSEHFDSELDSLRPWVRRIVEVLAERVRRAGD
ncbi:MAG: serine/threonine protein kinase [Verrucomicrobiales bacterium]|jgi:serine/threonine protein kinase